MCAMRFLADLHVHSRFSRATSRSLDLLGLHGWAKRKGLTVVGTGDFTHPAWRAELVEQLRPAEQGLYRLREDLRSEAEQEVPTSCGGDVRFVLQVEISTIYKADGKTRKVHHVILCPDLEEAEQLGTALGRIGNVSSDGRPILGLDSRDLLEIVLENCPGGCLIPAHIWTPWFSVLGSKSGFDSIEECYRDLSDHIFAVETGLSSDPPMNWRCSSLDRFALISNSDAHSAAKLGRECNLFDTEISYDNMMDALSNQGDGRFLGTIEFFPEEGKYHLDGHRRCDLRLTPKETREADGRCPTCGRAITVGVMHRVEALADRADGDQPQGATSFKSLIGLAETVGHAMGRGPATKGVTKVTEELLSSLGPELPLLQDVEISEIERVAGDMVAEAVRRVRTGEVSWDAGYDGEYGTFEIFSPNERLLRTRQISFFADRAPKKAPKKSKVTAAPEKEPDSDTSLERIGGVEEARGEPPKESLDSSAPGTDNLSKAEKLIAGLGPEQRAAVLAPAHPPLLVVAGPGTGKTRTLTTRIAHGVATGRLEPSQVLALTFTNRAAAEMAERLQEILGEVAQQLEVSTFHAYGLGLLRAAGLARPRILDERERLALVREALTTAGVEQRRKAKAYLEQISLAKAGVSRDSAEELEGLAAVRDAYEETLERVEAMDFDDLVLQATVAVENDAPGLPSAPRAVFVDEYQDLNPVQVRLLHALVGAEVELFAIGDPDQAIYGFRGADPSLLIGFERDWGGAQILSLGRSYRSSDIILEAAGQVIAHAPGLGRPRLWSGLEGRPHLAVLTSRTERTEAERIALFIERLMGGTSFLSFDSDLLEEPQGETLSSFGDVAVLYRLRSQAEALGKTLARLGLPIQTASPGEDVFDDEVAEVLAALRLLAGRMSGSELDASTERPWAEAVSKLPPSWSEGKAAEVLGRVYELLDKGPPERSEPLAPLLRVARHLDSIRPVEVGSRGIARAGRPLDELLDWVALHTEQDLGDPRAEKISLLTLHASKGLEWPVVIIAGCEDGLVPYRRPDKPVDLDEERRLFFVGMTRAEQLLVLSHAEERTIYGERRERPPSPFLLDIEERYKRREESGGAKKRAAKKRGHQLELF